ncbi:MAG: DNA internalization-related competence protein ComEC/Rec2 [Gammaproteobacteria bacterium]|nr:DNA internalization-related competence protein ComEC/Rec2 [Gammaproteobacteria bacterium]MCW5583090.1 DNA internalization-related competence protein ComEC/Rec2 [Gammaproteobacteria bacterium]
MIPFVITFLVGVLYLQTFPFLPTNFMLYGMLIVSVLLYLIFKKLFRHSYLLIAFSLGLFWSSWYAGSLLSWTLQKEWESKPLIATGRIASLPVKGKFGIKFEFRLMKLEFVNKTEYPNTLIRLSWNPNMKSPNTVNHSHRLHVGEEWKLLVRLKRIHGVQSPGAFDFEAWALQKGIRATGNVINGKHNHLLSNQYNSNFIQQLRQLLQSKIESYIPISPTSPWLTALIIGEHNGIAQDDWQVLRKTGTNHLMAIAGLHIGMIAGLTSLLVSWLWRRIPWLILLIPAPLVGSCSALIIAIFYSALSGFSIPTQRACIMLTIFISAIFSKRKINPWHVWSLALLCVLMINPLCVLTESFWLSFGTIALIIYGMSGRLSPTGLWWKWGRVQWVIGIGLIPLTLALFQQCSLISFVANTIAIPWLGLLILPFCLLGAFCLFISPHTGVLLLSIADKSLAGLWVFLAELAKLNLSTLAFHIPNYAILVFTIIGFLLLLLPAGLPGRWLGVIWIMPLLTYQPAKPALGDVWLTLLDVGQGLSVIIQTKEHILIYDAGPKYDANIDMGESVVLPYFNTLAGNKKIDLLVVSHSDMDHLGGAQAILKATSVTKIKTSSPEKLPSPDTSYCRAGEKWQWDQVNFLFLYPTEGNYHLRNNSSCVLRIDNGKHRILLTGDIEKYAENSLLSTASTDLPADIMIAPHHGSKTSGLETFIHAVHPQIVLYAIGYKNRYHFPHPSVVSTYAKINTIQLNTVESGTIVYKIKKDGLIPKPEEFRVINKRYWKERITAISRPETKGSSHGLD